MEKARSAGNPFIQLLLRAGGGAAGFYPFTFPGTLLLSAAVLLLVRDGAGRGNPYAMIISFASLLFLAAAAAGCIFGARLGSAQEFVWEQGPFIRACEPAGLNLSGVSVAAPRFFRYHFICSGLLEAGEYRGRGRWEFVFTGDDSSRVPTPVLLPYAGSFTCRGRIALRDIFGLTRRFVGEPHLRTFTIRPRPVMENRFFPVEESRGEEERESPKDSDSERYYQREYAPGDRLRDINWKASSRLSVLLTRISPQTKDKTRVITVIFRNCFPDHRLSLDALMHLDYLKGWCAAFVGKLREEHPEYHFRIVTADSVDELKDPEQIEGLPDFLSGVTWRESWDPGAFDVNGGPFFVFSTCFDRDLPSFFGNLRSGPGSGGSGKNGTLFLTQTAGGDFRRNIREPEAGNREREEIIPLSLFCGLESRGMNGMFLPGGWVFNGFFSGFRTGRGPAVPEPAPRIIRTNLGISVFPEGRE